MEQETPDSSAALTDNAQEALAFGQRLAEIAAQALEQALRPWNAYQLGIAVGLLFLSTLLAKPIGNRFREWLRTREGWPRWRIKTGLIIHKRIRALMFIILIWTTIMVMREITWPSRSYLLAVIGNLALAWLIVAFATRLVANTLLRNLIKYGAWFWITLRILNITEETEGLLDAIALDLGETRISILLILQAIFILGVLLALARFLASTTTSRIRRNPEISPSMQVLGVKFAQILLYGAAFFIGLKVIGIDLTGLAFLSGAIGVGLGFGLQKVVSNLVSGVIILLDKSIKPGDVISLGDTFGWIHSLGARYVSVVTRDGREYLIPNEDLITGQVVNWSHSNEFVRLDIPFGTSYNDDPHLVRKLAVEAAGSVERVLTDRAPVCHVTGFGDSSVDFLLRFWIEDPSEGLTNIRGQIYLALWDTFQANGISIPFPQREVKLLEGSTLQADTKT